MHARTSASRLQDAVKKEESRMSNPLGNIRIKSNQIIQNDIYIIYTCDCIPLKQTCNQFCVMFQDIF